MIRFAFLIVIFLLAYAGTADARSHKVCDPACRDVPFTSQEEAAQDAIDAAAASAPIADPKDAAISSTLTAQNSVLKALLAAINNGQLTSGQNLTAAQLKALIKSNM